VLHRGGHRVHHRLQQAGPSVEAGRVGWVNGPGGSSRRQGGGAAQPRRRRKRQAECCQCHPLSGCQKCSHARGAPTAATHPPPQLDVVGDGTLKGDPSSRMVHSRHPAPTQAGVCRAGREQLCPSRHDGMQITARYQLFMLKASPMPLPAPPHSHTIFLPASQPASQPHTWK